VLRNAGESILPDSEGYQTNTPAAEAAADEFSLNLGSFMLKENKAWAESYERLKKIVEREKPDLIVGDEAAEISVNMASGKYLDMPRTIIIFDCIKWYSMTRKPMDIMTMWMVNRYWQMAYKTGDQWANVHSSVFIGEREDVPDERLGLLLMNARESTKYVQYVGDIIRFDPSDYQDKSAVRRKLGYGTEHLVVCSVGGTGIGRPLLELCGLAYPLLKKDFPDLRMVLVGGPRIKPETLNPPDGVEVMGYVPNLHEHFAASDIAVVQCGGTTCVELLVLQKPFLYFPLELHSEQQLTVSGKMKAHGATLEMKYSGTSPGTLAQAIKDNMGKEVHYVPLSIGGEKKIAKIMSDMLGKS
jgi:hypothetical protein